MKNIKKFEGYFYNNSDKIYQDTEMESAPESFWKTNPSYIPDHLEDFIPELTNTKNRLLEIMNELEAYGPIDEDIVDTIDALSKILNKWENRPINNAAKKYNL
jgi:hypothetical protein